MSDSQLPPDHPDEHDEAYWGPSKSQVKREAHEAQRIGVSLAELDATALDRLPISDRLREAVEELQQIRSHGAGKRQRQYIGRLMREEDIDAIEAGLRLLDPNSPENQRLQMQAEAWREALIHENDAITRFIDDFPTVDVQQLRQLQRNARTEAKREEYGKATRALFQAVRAEIAAARDTNQSQGTSDE